MVYDAEQRIIRACRDRVGILNKGHRGWDLLRNDRAEELSGATLEEEKADQKPIRLRSRGSIGTR